MGRGIGHRRKARTGSSAGTGGATGAGRHLQAAGLRGRLRASRQRRKIRKLLPHERPLREAVDLLEYSERSKTLRQQLIQNAVPLFSLATFAFVLLKVILVAKTNTGTSLAILQTAGTVQIVSGVIVLAIPFLATGINNAVAIWGGSTSMFNRLERRRLWYVYSLSLIYLSNILPWGSFILLLAFSAFYTARWFWRRRKQPSRSITATTEGTPRFYVQAFLQTPPDDAVLRRLWREYKTLYERVQKRDQGDAPIEAAADSKRFAEVADEFNARQQLVNEAQKRPIDTAAITLLATVLLPVVQQSINDRMWLPAEQIEVKGQDDVVGYVLNEGSSFATILRDDDRAVVRIETKDVESRAICLVDGRGGRTNTIYEIFADTTDPYPRCPD